jgi:hypothetical protein
MGWANALILTALTFLAVWAIFEMRGPRKSPLIRDKPQPDSRIYSQRDCK